MVSSLNPLFSNSYINKECISKALLSPAPSAIDGAKGDKKGFFKSMSYYFDLISNLQISYIIY